MEPEFAEKAALIKYHATMLRRQLVRELCVVYENIFDRAAERECKSIAIPGAVPAVHASRDITELRNLKSEGGPSGLVAAFCDRDFYWGSRLSQPYCRRSCNGHCAAAHCRRYMPRKGILCGIR